MSSPYIDKALELIKHHWPDYEKLPVKKLEILELLSRSLVDTQVALAKLSKVYEGSSLSYRDFHAVNQPTIWLPPNRFFDVHLDSSEGPRAANLHFEVNGSQLEVYLTNGGQIAVVPVSGNHFIIETDYNHG